MLQLDNIYIDVRSIVQYNKPPYEKRRMCGKTTLPITFEGVFSNIITLFLCFHEWAIERFKASPRAATEQTQTPINSKQTAGRQLQIITKITQQRIQSWCR